MLTVTDSAWKRLSQIQTTRPDVSVLRLIHKDGQVKCRRGIQKRRDHVIEHAGRPTLLLTPTVAGALDNSVLDVAATKRGPRLRLRQDASSQ